jgi:Heterokaryon incompatibility protein (HET)
MKQWLQVCDLNHEGCRRRSEESTVTMPTRLIELGETIRLVNCDTIQNSRYVARSHCWGPLKDNEKFCAWKDKIPELEKSINFERLPLTFQHAITVARGLDINYIWIDSLCIIQDDLEDWERESARMEQVFSNAYCTIGASSAGSSLEGFLWERTPRACVQLHTKRLGMLYVCPNIDDFHHDVEEGKLNRRGWVLQERALSRRSIFYCSTQVYWECGDGVQCETLARLHK